MGDPDKPKLVFFFDEAHLLFTDAPKALLDKIEQVVRLIRSKGVGVYFVTQNPLDVPDTVLGQLGNRVQHALRAFTPRDQKAVQTAATTMRANPELDTEKVITELGVGEALVSFLDAKGTPAMVERAWILPPVEPHRTGHAAGARTGDQVFAGVRPLRADRGPRVGVREACGGAQRASDKPRRARHRPSRSPPPPASGGGRDRCAGQDSPGLDRPTRRTREGVLEAAAKSAARAVGSQVGARSSAACSAACWAGGGAGRRDNDLALEILVTGPAEDVAAEDESPDAVGHQTHARHSAGDHIGAHSQVGNIKPMRHVERSDLEYHRHALFEPDLSG